jgi:uncharacterized protein YhbP (UPF0306 family)
MLKQAEVEKVIRNYLAEIIHMSLATTDGNKPWVCEVHFVFDQDLNLYFRSLPDRRHSQEIATNPNVAGNMVIQHQIGEKPRAVYFEGKAERLEDVTGKHIVYTLFNDRFKLGPEIVKETKDSAGHQFYKISVDNFYLFDSRESSPSTKYKLSWKSDK